MRVLRIYHSAVVDEWRERDRTLRRRGHIVTTVTAQSWVEGSRAVSAYPSPEEDVREVRTFFGEHPALFCFDPRPLWVLLGQPWDVIDLHEEPYALASAEVLLLRALRRCRAPYVLYSAQNIRKRYPWPFRRLERRALRGAAAIHTCNSDAARIVREKGYPGRVDVLPLGTDLGHYRPNTGRSGRPWTVGFVGRLEPAKGLDVLLRALRRCPGVHLVVVGDGSARPELQSLAAELGLTDRVHWRGAQPPEVVQAVYRELDVVVVPSRDLPHWREQFGRVAVEAMASGVPVVASTAGALPDVVGGAGILVPQEDPSALAVAIERLREPALANQTGAAGRARAEQYSWSAVVDQLESIYTRTLPALAPRERRLRVVVVAYGDPSLLERCLRAMTPLPQGVGLTVVDNGSDPRTRALAEGVNAEYRDPGRNLGYATAANLGIATAGGADVLLVNPDALIGPEQIMQLHDRLLRRSDLAALAPAQLDGHGLPVRVMWPWPSPLTSWIDAVGLGRHRSARYVTGAVLLLRTEALAQVGHFDEDFFLYAEETDWQRRATRMGWAVQLDPEVTVRHLGGATSSDPSRRRTHFDAAQERYLRRHHGTTGWQLARAAILAGAAARWLVSPPHRPEMSARAATYWTGPLARERALRAETT